ncbi:MAG: RND family efflux transporter MFP subunit [Parcubacteria group bacterium GW2011_GWB1_37_13]|nr:MAG: RND family efflux transporter MFP subunit [Parcubacteria group bacterium GW2011_GWB1_37_13]
MSNAFVDFSDIITGLDDVLNENNLSDSSARTYGSIARSYRDKAEELYYQTEKSYKNSQADFRLLSRDSSHALIETAINATYKTAKMFADAIKSARNFVDYMAEDSNNSSEFTSSKNTIAEYTDTMNDHLSALSFAKDDVNNYKEAFFDTDLNIKDLELTIKQKENNLQDAKNKLSDYRIRAPFDGVVTKIDAKVGEIAPANEPLVTMMNAGTFQIESYVPEVNIALINIGDEANVTLDAYGKNVLFYARVVSIDPAETIRDGVSTYKIKLQFSENDNRIKSGMTANVSILIFSKPNVIVVPGGVVFEKGGKKYIQIKKDKKIINKEVTLGDASPLGQVEVVSGLADGDTVILNPLVSS